MTHEQIQDNEVIERYVRQQLTAADRQAFQEHYFACDECFEQTQLTARFIAGVRDASASGVLAAEHDKRDARSSWLPALFEANWIRNWAVPALAMSFLLAALLLGLWAFSVRRENQRLARQASEERLVAEALRRSEAKIRELEASGTASQTQLEELRKENERLKEEVAAAGRPRETQVAQLRPPDAKVPVINIYPQGDPQRSGGSGEVNQLRLPRTARNFVLLLSDVQSGYPTYQVEVSDSFGKVVARRAALKPDRFGELRVTLDRSRLIPGKYTIKVLGRGKPIAEYRVEIE